MGFSNADSLADDLAAWKSEGELQTLLGYKIFVKDEGDKSLPTILLIHGFPTSSWDWQAVWKLLKNDFRLVALDLLGFGYSDKPSNRNYTIHQQADLVEALVKEKSLTGVHVLAHDYGDTVAQELLARQVAGRGVDSWVSCCFLNGGLFPETHRALLAQKLLLSPLGPLFNRLVGFKKFSVSFSSVFGKNTQPSQEELILFWRLINENNGKHIFHNLITYMRDRKIHRERWVSVLQNSNIPLALINGAADPVSGSHMVARYKALSCRLDYLASLDSIGHYPQVEAPEDVLQHYQAFLALID